MSLNEFASQMMDGNSADTLIFPTANAFIVWKASVNIYWIIHHKQFLI